MTKPSDQARAVALAIAELVHRAVMCDDTMVPAAREILAEKLDALVTPCTPPLEFVRCCCASIRDGDETWRCDRRSDEPDFEGHADHAARKAYRMRTWRDTSPGAIPDGFPFRRAHASEPLWARNKRIDDLQEQNAMLRARNAELNAINSVLQHRVLLLRARNADLEARVAEFST